MATASVPIASLKLGDCLDIMRGLSDASFDSLITDPPAGIAFMGKDWDKDKGGRDEWVAWMTEVMAECLRVLKPGAHGLVWALPRVSHWTATALEDAGFEVRDIITHLFGTGFPKSLDVSKAIDKAAGAEREVVGKGPKMKPMNNRSYGSARPDAVETSITAPSTAAAKQWSGWHTALKPASEHWILVRKPLGEKTIAANVLKHGTGAVNVDGSRIDGKPRTTHGNGNFQSKSVDENLYQHGMKAGYQCPEPTGRFPANLILSHNPDCEQVGVKKVGSGDRKDNVARVRNNGLGLGTKDSRSGAANSPDNYGTETVPAWRCTEGCAVAELDRQSGTLTSGARNGIKRPSGTALAQGAFQYSEHDTGSAFEASKGGASRFFYCSKASKSDRGADNNHPTVKSTKLMRYLCRLITPPGGTVLDPFAGSGSTGIAALAEGFSFMGIDQEQEYLEISKRRLEAQAREMFAG